MPKRPKSRSFFTALPVEIKRQLRSQPARVDSPPEPEVVRQQASREPNPADLLPTQPPRPDDAGDDPGPSDQVTRPTEESSDMDMTKSSDVEAAPVSKTAVELAPVPSSSTTPTVTSSAAASSSNSAPSRSALGSSSIVRAVKRSSEWEGGRPSAKRQKGKGKAKEPASEEAENLYEGHPWDCTGLVPRYTDASEVPKHLKKYFFQRHALFPAYSRLPLLMDDTGWFSVTPASIADHIAERCRSDVVLDAFCGVGGNAIAFARTCERVIAMDVDPVRLQLARHNALHYGVADRIEFILCDYVQWAREYAQRGKGEREEIDVVFLSPPWGGPEYLSMGASHSGEHPSYPLSAILPIPGDELFKLTHVVSPNIAYFLPRNVDIEEVSALATSLGDGNGVHDTLDGSERQHEWVEMEEEWVGDKLKAVTAYYGSLVEGV